MILMRIYEVVMSRWEEFLASRLWLMPAVNEIGRQFRRSGMILLAGGQCRDDLALAKHNQTLWDSDAYRQHKNFAGVRSGSKFGMQVLLVVRQIISQKHCNDCCEVIAVGFL